MTVAPATSLTFPESVADERAMAPRESSLPPRKASHAAGKHAIWTAVYHLGGRHSAEHGVGPTISTSTADTRPRPYREVEF